MPVRTDRAYWARLRKDRRSNLAAGLVAVAALCATVCCISIGFEGSPGERRLDPLYWAAFLPLAVWGSALTGFEAWAVRLLRPVAWMSTPISALAVWAVWRRDGSLLAIDMLLLVIGAACAVAGLSFYRGSLVCREGPAR